MKRGKVAILTWHHYDNFGSVLQAYALQHTISKLNLEVQIIDYRSLRGGKIHGFKEEVKFILGEVLQIKRYQNPFTKFRKNYYNMSHLIQEKLVLQDTIKSFDFVICGSDQIWAPNVFDSVYMLDFVPEKITKISYAASIGLNTIPIDMVDIYKKLLSRFRAISVRENKGALLLKELGIESTVVLDPTLLIDTKTWQKHENAVKTNKKFIFCYFLKTNHNYKNVVENYAKKNYVDILGCSANKNDSEWMTLVNSVGPKEFLWLIHHAEAIFTDSYHGTIFSILYHKDFITFERFENTDEICQNSRISQLDDYFHISNRILKKSDYEKFEIIPAINYSKIEKNISEQRYRSMDFLYRALGVECCILQ